MIKFDVVTIFPDIFKGFIEESLIARAQKKKLIKIDLHNLRKWTYDRHNTVDDKPYGGGVGMVMLVEPIMAALKSIQKAASAKATASRGKKTKSKIILFSPRGKKFDQETAKRWAKLDQLIMISGRYEGIDERVANHLVDEVVSVGDYVLFGGEVPAMAVIEAVSRQIPGVIAKEESSSKSDHAQYTRPEVLKIKGKKRKVPAVLLSGDHKKIEDWRKKN